MLKKVLELQTTWLVRLQQDMPLLLREYGPTTVISSLTSIALAQPQWVALLGFVVALVLVIWFAYSLVVVWCKHQQRRSQLVKMTNWIITLVFVVEIHSYYVSASRS